MQAYNQTNSAQQQNAEYSVQELNQMLLNAAAGNFSFFNKQSKSYEYVQEEDLDEYVEELVLSGANPNAQNAFGDSALQIACLRGDFNMAEILTDNGATTYVRANGKDVAEEVAQKAENLIKVLEAIQHAREEEENSAASNSYSNAASSNASNQYASSYANQQGQQQQGYANNQAQAQAYNNANANIYQIPQSNLSTNAEQHSAQQTQSNQYVRGSQQQQNGYGWQQQNNQYANQNWGQPQNNAGRANASSSYGSQQNNDDDNSWL